MDKLIYDRDNTKRPLRIVYFLCGPLQKLFTDKRKNKRKVTLNPMILNEQLSNKNKKKSIDEKQLKKSNQ